MIGLLVLAGAVVAVAMLSTHRAGTVTSVPGPTKLTLQAGHRYLWSGFWTVRPPYVELQNFKQQIIAQGGKVSALSYEGAIWSNVETETRTVGLPWLVDVNAAVHLGMQVTKIVEVKAS